jgi:carboxylesterase
MNILKIDGHTGTRASTVPFYREGSNGEAVLLLHGYNGYVPDLVYCAERLHQKGFTVLIPRLPGHGTNASDFQQSGWKDWLRRSCDSFFDLKSAHRKVHVLGFSMGGMLALISLRHLTRNRWL